MFIVSACLAGIRCRWDGRDSLRKDVQKLVITGRAIPLCPEAIGGLGIPREPSEILGGGGRDVILGKAHVFSKSGQDVTGKFLKGAKGILSLAKEMHISQVIFKARSCSCGKGMILDGNFSGKLKGGNGVTSALLLDAEIEVISDEEYVNRLRK